MSGFNFYEMLTASDSFHKWDNLSICMKLYSQLMEKELEVAKQTASLKNVPGKLLELFLHKCEVERDILKQQLEDQIHLFHNPPPPTSAIDIAKAKELFSQTGSCCLRKKSSPGTQN